MASQNRAASDTVSYPRRQNTSSILLWKP